MNELERSRLGVRLLSVLLALDIAKNFVSPAMWIAAEEKSVIYTVAQLAAYPEAMAAVWLLSAAMVGPYVLMQIFLPECRYARQITKLACNGVCLGGVLWVYLAYLSRNLDYDIVTPLFLINGLGSIALGAVLAYGLNAEQIAAEAVRQVPV